MVPVIINDKTIALLSAALRHARDAELLVDVDKDYASLDQAYHLAGYAAECSRKAVLVDRSFDKAIGHGFDEISEKIVELAVSLDPLAQRYSPADWAERYSALASWNVSVRYDRTGTRNLPEVVLIVAQARESTDKVLMELWCDGRLPSLEKL